MSDPSLDRATRAIGDLSTSVRSLHAEVVQSETLRSQKIKLITAALIVLVPAVALLVIMAITNFVLLAKTNDAADEARSTNELLYGCFQPGTKCSNENLKNTAAALDQLRRSQIQAQSVIAVCQRLHPVTEDPAGTAMVACVQQYYPGFALPPKVQPSPAPSRSAG
jgi:hypothetical protein